MPLAERPEGAVISMDPLGYELSPNIVRLLECKDELVPAEMIAPVVGMKPDRIREYARAGQWPREICNYIVSGSHVKFYRLDFLKRGNWI